MKTPDDAPRTALVTGGAGFIGSHLADALAARGDRVIVIDDLSTGSRDNLSGLIGRPGFEFVRDSVCSEWLVTDLIGRSDVVFHLAAAVGVQLIADDPIRTIEANLHGTEAVLRAARRYGRKVLIASTSEVYGKSTQVPFSEDDDMMLGSTRYPRWSYACTKILDEYLGLAYLEQFGLPVVVCRFFNTIGPRQTGAYGMVAPRFVDWALRDESIQVYGTGEQGRCFCHVADVVEMLLALADCDEAVGEVVNLGNDSPVTINELADLVIELTGSASEKVHVGYEEAYGRPMDDLMVRVPDLRKVRRLTGIRSTRPLDDTLRDIIADRRGRLGARTTPGSAV